MPRPIAAAVKPGALLALLALAGQATAQIAPPPTQAPEEAPAVQAPQIRPAVPPGRGNPPPQPRQDDIGAQIARAQQDGTIPNLPYESLVIRDAQGKVVPLEVSPHLLALERNPMMDDSTIERAQGVIAERRARLEEKIIEHIDLIQQVLDGAIDRAVITDQASIARVVEIVRPFQETGHLTEDLKTQGVITQPQYLFNWKIVREYEQAMQQQIMADAAVNPAGDHPGTYMTRQIMGDFLREPMGVYNAMLAEAATRLDDVLEGIALEGQAADDVAAHRAAAERAGSDEERSAAMRELTSDFSVDQKRQLLENLVNSRF